MKFLLIAREFLIGSRALEKKRKRKGEKEKEKRGKKKEGKKFGITQEYGNYALTLDLATAPVVDVPLLPMALSS